MKAPSNLHRPFLLMALIVSSMLAACGADEQELQQWMDSEKKSTFPKVDPLDPPKKFDPQPYTSATEIDPFSSRKMGSALKSESGEMTEARRREMNRRKEPLESFPLDSMAMVGSVVKGGQQFALLRVDKLLYQVKVGDYLGENSGRIMKITETEITLRESVFDAANEPVERIGTLQLQERAR